MKVQFAKYQALGNTFIVLESGRAPLQQPRLADLARAICDVRTGVGADGILYLSKSSRADRRIDVFNADGSWAEKSGNGLRIAAVALSHNRKGKKEFLFEIGGSLDRVRLEDSIPGGFMVRAELGKPDFRAARVPVRTKLKHLINVPVRFGAGRFEVTCLSVGNPHLVIAVDSFDFDWKGTGRQLEHDRLFPHGTNVEFVKAVNRHKVRVDDWERGAGATGSSGTGAAAAVCAMVMLGRVERTCEVQFETGSLFVRWRADDDIIELSGPVAHIISGSFEYFSRVNRLRAR